MHTRLIGLFLILGGLLFFIQQSNHLSLYSFTRLSFLLFLLGLVLIAIAFLKTNGSLALIGGMIASIGIYKWGMDYIQGWPADFEILVMLIGISFLIQFMITKHHMTGVIGLLILLCGLFAWPEIKEIPFLTPIASFLNLYWPVLMIGFGFVLFTRK